MFNLCDKVRNKNTNKLGIVIRKFKSGSIAVLESISPIVINTHSSEKTLEIFENNCIEMFDETKNNNGMKFNEAYIQMRLGKKVALPEWKGYWYWNEDLNTIMIHLANGEELDLRQTDDMSYTFGYICREEWIIK